MPKKYYNTTDLDPESAFNKHIYHRDQFAHYLRWTHILKECKINETICDFGCGNGNLLEVLYRNRIKQTKYIGLDIRDKFRPELLKLDWVEFHQQDLINTTIDLNQIQADKVVSFEVIEHVGKQNVNKFLTNMKKCGNEHTTYYISTPIYDEKVGSADNHTYDSGDGRGKVSQEFTYNELKTAIENNGFTIIDTFGTFASQKDYKPFMNEWQTNMFNELKKYYDSNLVSNLMAPFFPEQSRNTLWKLAI